MLKISLPIKLITLLGFVFLYAPIIILIIFSFNESRLVTVWSGFSFQWYGKLLQNEPLLHAAWTSLRIAFATACGATLLGTLASYALMNKKYKFSTLMQVLFKAPLVVPEVIMGFSLLLVFVTCTNILGIPQGRGMLTIWIAHVTVSVAYVTIVISVRLSQFDKTLLLAARDLGAKPLTTFIYITLPLIAPALISGWLLAFTLSFDDLVIASFTSGPDSTTLPMMIYSSVRLGVSPEMNALASILIMLVTCCALIFCLTLIRQKKKMAKSNVKLV